MRISCLIIFCLTTLLFSCQNEVREVKKVPDNELIKNHYQFENQDTISVDTSNVQSNDKLENSKNICSYDNQVSDLGIGLVISPSKFDVYNDSLLNNKYVSWDMYEHEDEVNVCSKFYKPDYGIMHFVCVDTTDKVYKVLVNYSDFKYLPKTKSYEFKTWEEYILQSFGIRRLKVHTDSILVSNPLRVKSQDNSDTLIIPKGHEMFCPMEIKDDWIRVKYDCFYNDENNPNEGEPCYNFIEKCQNPLVGWLRWRHENKLIIDIFLIP